MSTRSKARPTHARIRLHRFHSAVGFDLLGTDTLYINAADARDMGRALLDMGERIETTHYLEDQMTGPIIINWDGDTEA